MNTKTKKGFTLTELIIVVVIIGILAAVLIPTLTACVKKAKISNDKQLVRNLNIALSTDSLANRDGEKHKNMQEALDAAEIAGYIVDRINATKADNEILWDSKNDVFCYLNDGKIEYIPSSVASGDELDDDNPVHAVKLWQIVKLETGNLKSNQFSVYAAPGSVVAEIETNKGFDAGKLQFPSVSYDRTGEGEDQNGHQVIIRTNSASTTLAINGYVNSSDNTKGDIISHYGSVGSLNIIKCASGSYHENGKVAFAEISTGRIVLESESDIKHIHINSNGNNAFEEVIIKDNGTEKLPEAITRDAVTVENKTLVVTVESASGVQEPVYVYASTTTGTTEKLTEGEKLQNENVNSALGQLVLDNGSNPGEKAQTAEQKAEAKQEVVETAIEKENYKGDVYILLDGDAPDAGRYATFAEFRDEVNGLNGKEANTFAGYTVTLQVNVDLGFVEWTPIGTSEHPFSGVFDGQNHEIKNYKIRGEGENVGLALFGFIEGTNNTDVATFTKDTPLSNFYNTSTYTVYLPSEDVFTCAVKNLNVANADVNTTADGWTAAVVAYVKNATISNVNLSNSILVANQKIGGIAGAMYNDSCCLITNCSTASNVSITANTGNHCAGILSRVLDSGHALIANCTNNATIQCHGVNGSGIAGQSKGTFFYNDTNNGDVTGGTRAAGIATDCCTSTFIGCTNTGHIKANNSMSTGKSSDSIAGIGAYFASTGDNVVVNCQNSGIIEGTCAYNKSGAKIAGIAAGGLDSSAIILNNANTGTLINHAEDGKTYDICDLSSVPTVVEPTNLEELNAATTTNNKYVKVTSSIALSNGDTITVNDQEKLEFVNSPAYLTIDLTNSNANSFVIMVNNTTVTLVNGSGKVVTVSGKGNTVVVEAEQSIKSLRVSNEDAQVASSLDLAGTADIILLNGGGLVNAEVKDDATVGRVCFGGTGTFVLTNRGKISHKTEGQYGAEHTIDTITASNITIYNHGTIEAKKNSDDVVSYALLFYGGAKVKFYAYEGSLVRQEKGSVMAHKDGSIIEFYYEDGAELIYYDSNHEYPDTFKYDKEHITVTKMN